MNTYFGIESCKSLPEVTLTFGKFDGLHRGHTTILKEAIEKAKLYQTESLIVIFEPMPTREGSCFLSSLRDRLQCFEEFGFDHVLVLPFNNETEKEEGKFHLFNVLRTKMTMAHIIMGHDQNCIRPFQFVDFKKLGFAVAPQFHSVECIMSQGLPITTERIRQHIEYGQIEQVNAWLGYSFRLKGEMGHRIILDREKQVLESTIRIYNPCQLMPHEGTYSVIVRHKNKEYEGELSLTKEALSAGKIDILILGFNDSMIERDLTVDFIKDVVPFDGAPSKVLVKSH